MNNLRETELAKSVINWLTEQHWEVYQEVQFSPNGCIADIVAERHGVLWIVETKMTYGFAVLEQATRWPVHYRSVAVPWARNRDYRVAKYYYRVGIIEVNNEFKTYVTEVERPPLFSRNRELARKYKGKLLELHKTFVEAGSKAGQHLTPYKQTMIEVRKVIEANPGCCIKFLYKRLGNMHYSSMESFKGNLIKSLIDFENDWCKVDMAMKPYKLFVLPQPLPDGSDKKELEENNGQQN